MHPFVTIQIRDKAEWFNFISCDKSHHLCVLFASMENVVLLLCSLCLGVLVYNLVLALVNLGGHNGQHTPAVGI